MENDRKWAKIALQMGHITLARMGGKYQDPEVYVDAKKNMAISYPDLGIRWMLTKKGVSSISENKLASFKLVGTKNVDTILAAIQKTL